MSSFLYDNPFEHHHCFSFHSSDGDAIRLIYNDISHRLLITSNYLSIDCFFSEFLIFSNRFELDELNQHWLKIGNIEIYISDNAYFELSKVSVFRSSLRLSDKVMLLPFGQELEPI